MARNEPAFADQDKLRRWALHYLAEPLRKLKDSFRLAGMQGTFEADCDVVECFVFSTFFTNFLGFIARIAITRTTAEVSWGHLELVVKLQINQWILFRSENNFFQKS